MIQIIKLIGKGKELCQEIFTKDIYDKQEID